MLTWKRSLFPLKDHVQLPKDRIDLYLTLLEHLFFPHLGPRLWGMAEHLPESAGTLTLYRHTAVRTEDD